MKYYAFKNYLYFNNVEYILFILNKEQYEFQVIYEIKQNKYYLNNNSKKIGFNSITDFLNTKCFNGQLLEEVFDYIKFIHIDFVDPENVVQVYENKEFSVISNIIENRKIDSETLSQLQYLENNGDIVMYAGTHEISDFRLNEEEYKYYLTLPRIDLCIIIESINNSLNIEILRNNIVKTIKADSLPYGRLIDGFDLRKNLKNKSNRYFNVLKYLKFNNKTNNALLFCIISYFVLIISLFVFVGISIGIPIFLIPMFICLFLMVTLTFVTSKLTTMQYKKREELFPLKNINEFIPSVFYNELKESNYKKIIIFQKRLKEKNLINRISKCIEEKNSICFYSEGRLGELCLLFLNECAIIEYGDYENKVFSYYLYNDLNQLLEDIYVYLINYNKR